MEASELCSAKEVVEDMTHFMEECDDALVTH